MTRIFEELLQGDAVGDGTALDLFDLADPASARGDIATAIDLIAKFKHARSSSASASEGRQIGGSGFRRARRRTMMSLHASKIRAKLGVETVVIHPVAFAAAADAKGTAAVQGPFIEKPKITTGAGDHFNAGFCVARMLGAPLDISLQIGVGTSGFYVRSAKSPTAEDMVSFLRSF